jgi:hypothetical protein
MSLDENTYYLNQYEANQDQLEKKWTLSLPEKREVIVNYAKSIMKREVDEKEFAWAFTQWTKDCEYAYVEFEEFFKATLEDWVNGNKKLIDKELLENIGLCALEASAQLLEDRSIYDMLDDGYKLKKLVKEVIKL